MKQQLLVFTGLMSVAAMQAHASITEADMALQKQSKGNAPSYVQNVDTSRRTVTIDQVSYTIDPNAVVHDGKKITTISSIQKGSRVKIESEKKPGQWNTIKEVWVMQQPSGK